MKIVICFFLTIPTMLYSQSKKKGIDFITNKESWEEIKCIAKRENKYIFVDAYTTWCLPCKKMDKEVYSNDTLGSFLNSKFISVKIQIDSTKNDNQEIKRQYSLALYFEKQYNITVFPTFLFFNHAGDLVFKDFGFKTASQFIQLGNIAIDPKNIKYFSQLNKYKNGEKVDVSFFDLALYAKSLGETKIAKDLAKSYIDSSDTVSLLSLSKIYFVKSVAKNYALAERLAKIYKTDSLDWLSENKICNKEYLLFFDQFAKLIHSSDRIFKLCYYKARNIDSIIMYKGWSFKVVKMTISTEEIENKLFKDGSLLVEDPDWGVLAKNIHKKYPDINSALLIMDYRLKFYSTKKDWKNYVKVLIERVDRNGPWGLIEGPSFVDFNLNNNAWDIFQHSYEQDQLLKALSWSDSAINISKRSRSDVNLPNWMDTKANLIYKLGKIQEAIELQTLVTSLDKGNEEFKLHLAKMKAGEPTWLVTDEKNDEN